MALTDCQSITMDTMAGAWIPSSSGLTNTSIPITNGQECRNCKFYASGVQTRFGYTSIFNPANIISALLNWLFLNGTTPANYLVYFAAGVGIRIANLGILTPSTAIPQVTAATASICPLGSRLYVGFMDANGIGVAPGEVYGFGVGADPLFAAPITTVPTFIEAGANITTPGAKYFGYLIQTR